MHKGSLFHFILLAISSALKYVMSIGAKRLVYLDCFGQLKTCLYYDVQRISTWESSKSWRVCDQIETLIKDMLPNANDHATKLTLFDKRFPF